MDGDHHHVISRVQAVLTLLMLSYPRFDYRLTMLELHKLAHLQQMYGHNQPHLHFEMQQYGLYSPDFHPWMISLPDSYLQKTRYQSLEHEIEISPDSIHKAVTVFYSDNHTQELFTFLKNLIQGFETPYGLEPLTTVHWVKQLIDGTPNSEDMLARIQCISKRNRQLFKQAHIELALNHLGQ